jgi:dihydrolipoamide dehydrogenase
MADGAAVLDSDRLTELSRAPDSLLVVGGGAIGLEMADFLRRLGTRITLVEAQTRLLPAEDPELSAALARVLAREGVALRLGRGVVELGTEGGRARLALAGGEVLTAELVLVATGREPSSAELGLETVGAACADPGWVRTDETLRAAENLYAVGDVNGRTLLAHAAAHQARYAVAHFTGRVQGAYDSGPMPACVYGSTEVLRVGATATELAGRGGTEVSRATLVANPAAQALGRTQGLVKVFWREGRVAGVTALGPRVSQLASLAEVLVAEAWEAERIREFVFPHPSLDEALSAALTAARAPL